MLILPKDRFTESEPHLSSRPKQLYAYWPPYSPTFQFLSLILTLLLTLLLLCITTYAAATAALSFPRKLFLTSTVKNNALPNKNISN